MLDRVIGKYLTRNAVIGLQASKEFLAVGDQHAGLQLWKSMLYIRLLLATIYTVEDV